MATGGPCPTCGATPREIATNGEGLTWEEWRAAAGAFGAVEASAGAWLRAWRNGEDPTEYAAAAPVAPACDWCGQRTHRNMACLPPEPRHARDGRRFR